MVVLEVLSGVSGGLVSSPSGRRDLFVNSLGASVVAATDFLMGRERRCIVHILST